MRLRMPQPKTPKPKTPAPRLPLYSLKKTFCQGSSKLLVPRSESVAIASAPSAMAAGSSAKPKGEQYEYRLIAGNPYGHHGNVPEAARVPNRGCGRKSSCSTRRTYLRLPQTTRICIEDCPILFVRFVVLKHAMRLSCVKVAAGWGNRRKKQSIYGNEGTFVVIFNHLCYITFYN